MSAASPSSLSEIEWWDSDAIQSIPTTKYTCGVLTSLDLSRAVQEGVPPPACTDISERELRNEIQDFKKHSREACAAVSGNAMDVSKVQACIDAAKSIIMAPERLFAIRDRAVSVHDTAERIMSARREDARRLYELSRSRLDAELEQVRKKREKGLSAAWETVVVGLRRLSKTLSGVLQDIEKLGTDRWSDIADVAKVVNGIRADIARLDEQNEVSACTAYMQAQRIIEKIRGLTWEDVTIDEDMTFESVPEARKQLNDHAAGLRRLLEESERAVASLDEDASTETWIAAHREREERRRSVKNFEEKARRENRVMDLVVKKHVVGSLSARRDALRESSVSLKASLSALKAESNLAFVEQMDADQRRCTLQRSYETMLVESTRNTRLQCARRLLGLGKELLEVMQKEEESHLAIVPRGVATTALHRLSTVCLLHLRYLSVEIVRSHFCVPQWSTWCAAIAASGAEHSQNECREKTRGSSADSCAEAPSLCGAAR